MRSARGTGCYLFLKYHRVIPSSFASSSLPRFLIAVNPKWVKQLYLITAPTKVKHFHVILMANEICAQNLKSIFIALEKYQNTYNVF